MRKDEFAAPRDHLLTMLAEQYLEGGGVFHYEHLTLTPDDFTDLMTVPMLIFAQHTAALLKLGDLGYDFSLMGTAAAESPFSAARRPDFIAQPSLEYPLLLEIFEVEIMAHRQDLSYFMQQAGALLGWTLVRNEAHEQQVFETVADEAGLTAARLREADNAQRFLGHIDLTSVRESLAPVRRTPVDFTP